MNSVVHFELPAKDMKRSQKFYQDVFGWKFSDMDGYAITQTTETGADTMPLRPGAINGGMLTEESNGGMNPILVLAVDNLDESLKKAIAAGATQETQKQQIYDMGFYAKIRDTEGVVIGMFEPTQKYQDIADKA